MCITSGTKFTSLVNSIFITSRDQTGNHKRARYCTWNELCMKMFRSHYPMNNNCPYGNGYFVFTPQIAEHRMIFFFFFFCSSRKIAFFRIWKLISISGTLVKHVSRGIISAEANNCFLFPRMFSRPPSSSFCSSFPCRNKKKKTAIGSKKKRLTSWKITQCW